MCPRTTRYVGARIALPTTPEAVNASVKSAPSTADLSQLDALTGGAFKSPTSGERATRLREWLASEPSIRVIVTGGEVRPGELSLIGAGPERTFAELNCDVMFLGVGGLHPEKGFTEYSLEDAQIKRAALAASSRCVVLADASKLDRICLATVAPIAAADVLISDAPPDHPALVAVRDAGVEVVSVTPLEV